MLVPGDCDIPQSRAYVGLHTIAYAVALGYRGIFRLPGRRIKVVACRAYPIPSKVCGHAVAVASAQPIFSPQVCVLKGCKDVTYIMYIIFGGRPLEERHISPNVGLFDGTNLMRLGKYTLRAMGIFRSV